MQVSPVGWSHFESCELESSVAARRLLTAIVRRAVLDFALYREFVEDFDDADERDLRARLAVDAAGWIFWDGEEVCDEEGRYTFRHICQLLGMDHKLIRTQALELTREDLKRFNGDGGRTG